MHWTTAIKCDELPDGLCGFDLAVWWVTFQLGGDSVISAGYTWCSGHSLTNRARKASSGQGMSYYIQMIVVGRIFR